jgi:acetyl/propionyl-CoA carboxylase alpha subunit
MKKRLLIANRSEIAIRIIRSAHKLGIVAVVFQSDREPDALYLQYADEVIAAKDAGDEKPVFLNPEKIVKLALEHEIDMIHPGYGFLSENPDFALLCENNGINFIGPSPQLIRDMGLKTVAKSMAIKAGLPLVPGSDGPVKDAAAAKEFADSIGYPVILKASAEVVDVVCVLWKNRKPLNVNSNRHPTKHWLLLATAICLLRNICKTPNIWNSRLWATNMAM